MSNPVKEIKTTECKAHKMKLLLDLLKESVAKCYQDDRFLIDRSMEQASVARVYFYMQCALNHDNRFESFRGLNLDCEYNKKGDEMKKTPRCPKETRPDIVLHQRGNNTNNLLTVEFKARRGNLRKHKKHGKLIDFVKLEDFTNGCIYNYCLGVYVKLNKREPKYTYFRCGREISETELLK